MPKNDELTTNNLNRYLATLLGIIGIVVAATVWATTEHSNIKDWTAEQDFVTKTQVTDIMKEQYVPLKEYMVVKTKLDNLCEVTKRIEMKLDRSINDK